MNRDQAIFTIGFAAVMVLAWNFAQSPGIQAAHAQQLAQAAGGEEEPPPPQFVGAERCKVCHNKEDIGAQYVKWSESKHAKAFATLATDKAREVAKSVGVAGNPQEAGECLKCHQTAYGEPEERLHAKFDKTQGVQCESCHGAGGDYWKKEIMKDKAVAIEKGLVISNEQTCLGCHTTDRPGADPNEPAFDYEERLEKIAHNKPKPEDGEAK